MYLKKDWIETEKKELSTSVIPFDERDSGILKIRIENFGFLPILMNNDSPVYKICMMKGYYTIESIFKAYKEQNFHFENKEDYLYLEGIIDLIKFQYHEIESEEILSILNEPVTLEKGQDENLILSSKTRRHLKRLGFFKTAIKWIEEHLIDLLGEGRTIKIIDFLKQKQQNPYSFSFSTKEHSYYSIISVLLKMYQFSYLPERKRVNEIAELKKELGDLVDNVALLNYKIQEVQKRLGTLQKQEEGMKFQRGKNK